METILAGDVGATNTRLALFDEGDLSEALESRVYRAAEHGSFEAILRRFLEEAAQKVPGRRPTRAGFGVAGTLEDHADGVVARMLNLDWVLDSRSISALLGGKPVQLVNDFAAIGYSVPRLPPSALRKIGGGEARPRAPIGVIGAGTGLGESILIWTGSRYQVITTEGGHADFAPRNAEEIGLLQFLIARHGHVSWERVVSGMGLVNIYEFLRDGAGLAEPPALAEALRGEDPASVISRAGLERAFPICERALELFVSAYGAEAGNLALKVLAKGGIYLAGGIAPKILPRLEEGAFRAAFEQKGRRAVQLRGVPTYVITHPQPGLMGAAIAALEA